MLSTLKHLFSSPRLQGESISRLPAAGAAKTTITSRAANLSAISPTEIDAAFCGLILGVQSPIDSYLNDFEKTALREIDRLLATNALAGSAYLPRLPAVVPLIMGTLNHKSLSTADLTSQLNEDAVLVSKVIQLANSPYYRGAEKISDLRQAVSVLGRVGVRQLVTSVAFKPLINLRAGHFTEISGTILWAQAQKAAIACDCMARQEKTDRFKAYLMAMVANTGFTLAVQVMDRHFDGNMVPRSQSFHQRLIKQAKTLSWLIAAEWGFPAVITDALEAQIEGRPVHSLGNILYAGDKLSKLHTLAERGRFKNAHKTLAQHLQGQVTDSFKACYETLAD